MLAFCHLFIGMVIGLVAYRYYRVKSVALGALLGSILPDLIDKPLGHILLQGSLDYGRIFGHGLLFPCALLVGALALKKTRYFSFALFLSLGVLSHQLLDLMWELPVSWLFPFLGEYGKHSFPNYFEVSLFTELTSPFEWLFLVSIVWLGTEMGLWNRWGPRGQWLAGLRRLSVFLTPALIALGVVWAVLGLADWSGFVDLTDYPQGYLMTALVASGGGLAVHHWNREGRLAGVGASLDSIPSE
jgi:membrane-bound metal-dependent hydrolase YbcI (DUF457 family)